MLAAVASGGCPAPVEITRDPARPRLFVVLREKATGAGFAAALSQFYRAHPETAYFDKLYDLTEYRAVVTHADVMVIVEAYCAANTDPQHPCRTAFVTHDPNFGLWATAMSHLFPGREHRAFPSFEAAEAFLAEPIEQRPPFVSG